MPVVCVRLKAKTEREDRDNYCYVYQRGGDLYHSHRNPSGWRESKFSLGTLEHHVTMYYKDRFYTTTSALPEYVKEKIEK